MRIGLLHEKMMSLIDGRYTEKWLKQEARAAGGKTRAKWSPEIQALARPIYDDIRRQVDSDDGAASRTLAKLLRDHDIGNISLSTLKRGLGLKK